MQEINDKILKKAQEKITAGKRYEEYKNKCDEARICYVCGTDLVKTWRPHWLYRCPKCRENRIEYLHKLY